MVDRPYEGVAPDADADEGDGYLIMRDTRGERSVSLNGRANLLRIKNLFEFGQPPNQRGPNKFTHPATEGNLLPSTTTRVCMIEGGRMQENQGTDLQDDSPHKKNAPDAQNKNADQHQRDEHSLEFDQENPPKPKDKSATDQKQSDKPEQQQQSPDIEDRDAGKDLKTVNQQPHDSHQNDQICPELRLHTSAIIVTNDKNRDSPPQQLNVGQELSPEEQNNGLKRSKLSPFTLYPPNTLTNIINQNDNDPQQFIDIEAAPANRQDRYREVMPQPKTDTVAAEEKKNEDQQAGGSSG